MSRYLVIYDYDSDESGWLVVEVSEAPKFPSYGEAKAHLDNTEALAE